MIVCIYQTKEDPYTWTAIPKQCCTIIIGCIRHYQRQKDTKSTKK